MTYLILFIVVLIPTFLVRHARAQGLRKRGNSNRRSRKSVYRRYQSEKRRRARRKKSVLIVENSQLESVMFFNREVGFVNAVRGTRGIENVTRI